MKISELEQFIREELNNILNENPIKKPSGRRFIPPTIEIPADIRNEFKSHFKLYKKEGSTDELFSINDKGVDILKQAKSTNSLPSGITKNDIIALVQLFKAGKEGKEMSKIDFENSDVLDKLKIKGLINGGSEYKLYISPLLKVTLDKIERGRPGVDYRKTDEFIKQVTEKIPSNIRGLLKKYATKIDSNIGMIPVDTPIKDVTSNRDIVFYNPYTLK